MIADKDKLFVVTLTTTKQEYIDNIFSLPKGGLFKYDPTKIKYETVQEFLKSYLPLTTTIIPTLGIAVVPVTKFTTHYVPQESDLYLTYGDCTMIVVEKV